MTIEILAKQGREQIHTGLAGIETSKLKQIRNQNLRACFNRMEEMRYHREFVARIHGKNFINDAASRTTNATWYTLESTEGNIIWIANSSDKTEDYSKIATTLKNKVRMIICVGNQSENFYKSLSSYVSNIQSADTLETAVNMALYNNIEEANVVFSPSCNDGIASDQLGKAFQLEVNEL